MSEERDFDFTDIGAYALYMDDEVRFGDLDVFGHVNNAALATYYDSMRMKLMAEIGFSARGDAPVVGGLVRLDMTFLAELTYPNRVNLAAGVLKLGSKSIHIASAIFCAGKCVSHSHAVLVPVDRKSRKGIALPDEMRAQLAEFMV